MVGEGTNSLVLNVLVKREDDNWIGHCLELDIVATSDDINQLKKDMIDLIVAQVDYAFSHDNLEYLFHPAPKEIWMEFYKCKKHEENKISLKKRGNRSFVPPWIIAKMCLAENAYFG